jgi:hypothetical protein
MSNYLTQAIRDVTVTATSHQLAHEHYLTLAQAIRYPQAIGPVLVLIVSFIGAMFGGDNDQYYFYANQVLSLLCLLTVAIDQYFGWTKKALSHANMAAQYFQIRDRLTRLKRQQMVKAQSADVIQPTVEKIEESYMVLLHKHRRPPSTFEQKALQVMRSTQSIVEAIERRRLSESKSKDHTTAATTTHKSATTTTPVEPAPATSAPALPNQPSPRPQQPPHITMTIASES